jgi:hypothetical protein
MEVYLTIESISSILSAFSSLGLIALWGFMAMISLNSYLSRRKLQEEWNMLLREAIEAQKEFFETRRREGKEPWQE